METYFATGDCYFEQNKPEFITGGANQFTIDDLLVDFPNEDDVIMNDTFFDISSSNSSVSGGDAPLSSNMSSYSLSGDELCLPYDEMAELEWLSSFTEESFSTDDLHNLQLISAVNKTPVTDTSSSVTHNRITSPIFQNDVLVPGKIRSKRSRAAPCDWSSRLLLLQPSANSPTVIINETKPTPLKKTDGVRRCLHCGSDKTPQWRRGPMGPKTLCNACGVRFKSGRLVPEYRPAASPSFVPAQHSNSHRKVMELRRQMELRNSQQQQLINRNSSFEGCNGSDEYLIHHQIEPNYMHMV